MSSHAHARFAHLLVLALAAALVACEEQPRATQAVVTISASGAVASALTAIEVEVYDPDASAESGERRPTGQRSFALVDQGASTFVTLPFSLGIPMTKKSRFLLVVKGYAGEALAIEQKALVAFRPRRTIEVSIDLVDVCLHALCARDEEDGCLEDTCLPDEDGRCGPVPERQGVVIEPGTENLQFGRADDPATIGELDAAIDDPEADGAVAAPEESNDAAAAVSAAPDADAGTIQAGPEPIYAGGCTSEGGCNASLRYSPGQLLMGMAGDESCSDCESGTFSPGGTAMSCTPWRDCAPGTYVVQTPSSAQDRVVLGECALLASPGRHVSSPGSVITMKTATSDGSPPNAAVRRHA